MKLLQKIKSELKKQLRISTPVNREEPVCNLKIELVGWQGEYHNKRALIGMARKLMALDKFEGDFLVFRDGSLVSRKEKGLHTYKATLDLKENFILDPDESKRYGGYGSPNVHLDNGTVWQIDPESLYPNSPLRLFTPFLSRPHYTLQGLYATLPNQKMSTKINALEKELQERTGFKNESIATRKETRLKLLEYQYRKRISDQ